MTRSEVPPTSLYTAPEDVRVGLVECVGDCYWRVFGPFPRVEAVARRERWNRSASAAALRGEGDAPARLSEVVAGWRYEVMEDLDRRLESLEASALREGRALSEAFHEVMTNLAWETGPVYVVRPAASGTGVAETLFGPVPRRMALHAMSYRGGYLAYQSARARDDLLCDPPCAVCGLVRVRAREWCGSADAPPSAPPAFSWLDGEPIFFTSPRPGRE